MLPKVTIAILSWNRLHYFRATIESARRCIQYPNLEWIVSDNLSDEPGLAEYIRQLDWIHHKIIKRQSHAEAMNEIVEVAQGEYLIIWPDDVQFIIEGDWLCDLIEILEKNPRIGSVTLDALRKTTLHSLLKSTSWQDAGKIAKEFYWYLRNYRFGSDYFSSRGVRMKTCGWRHSGICPSGIPSLTKTDIWRRIGPWRSEKNQHRNLIDSSAGAEDNMLYSFFLSKLPLQAGLPWLPVAADIITDPLGCKAKVRGHYRYGVYMPPQSSSGLYYEILQQNDISLHAERPLSFSEVVKPVGFQIPQDEQGDRLKFSLNTSVVFDTTKQCDVPFPLAGSSDVSS